MTKDDREKRLAEALRGNLRRRKAQARAMTAEDGAPPAPSASPPAGGREEDAAG